ncbi:MAG TPA: hypothetical protein VMS56_03845 [Thermoanaerobaculia bacterium]|nr:hypothetical protein [Thermoanaerobaculia bacterium]
MRHCAEVELLEEHYAPGSSGEIGEHLRSCAECARRLDELVRRVEGMRAEFESLIASKPEAFWERQTAAVMRRIHRGASGRRGGAAARWAVAATLLMVIGGGWWVRGRVDTPSAEPPGRTETAAQSTEVGVLVPTADPWDSEPLAGWGEAVAWESWLDQGALETGGPS